MVSKDVTKPAIDAQIHMIRGVSVLLDFDLASLYGVATGVLLQAVRRNRNRFPADFMFALSVQEVTRLRSQIVISKLAERPGGRRYQVHAFTEQGVAMLSSVLRSETAVRVNSFEDFIRAEIRFRASRHRALLGGNLKKVAFVD